MSTDRQIRNHAGFIWSVADNLRGVYKQSEIFVAMRARSPEAAARRRATEAHFAAGRRAEGEALLAAAS